MEAKRFTAGDMRRALQMVREHLGPDAVILSSRKNVDGVEVVATNDYRVEDMEAEQAQEIAPVAHKIYRQLTGVADDNLVNDREAAVRQDQVTINSKVVANTQVTNTKVTNTKVTNTKVAGTKNVAINESNHSNEDDDFLDPPESVNDRKLQLASFNREVNQDLTQMRYEIEGLRRMLTSQSGQTPMASEPSVNPLINPLVSKQQAELKQRMEWMGIPAAQHDYFLASKNFDTTQTIKQSWRALLQNMQAQMKVAPRDIVDGGGIFALVGSTGAGKTTTIAKLATRYALQYGAEQVGLISLDTNRVGGTQQLKTMGKLLGIPVRMVETTMELEVSLRAFRGRSLVMIDTAGVRPGSEELTRLLKTLQVDKRIQCLLTLPVTSQYSVMKTLLHCYQPVSKGLILTKLDEAVSLGEVIATVIDSQLAISYTTDGQLIPESIRLPNVQELMSLAVEKIRLRQQEQLSDSTKKQKINNKVSDLY